MAMEWDLKVRVFVDKNLRRYNKITTSHNHHHHNHNHDFDQRQRPAKCPTCRKVFKSNYTKDSFCPYCMRCWKCKRYRKDHILGYCDYVDLLVQKRAVDISCERFGFCLYRFEEHKSILSKFYMKFMGLKKTLLEDSESPLYKLHHETNVGCFDFYLEAMKLSLICRSFLAWSYVLRTKIVNKEAEHAFNTTQNLMEGAIKHLTDALEQNPPRSMIEVDEDDEDDDDEAFLTKEYSKIKANIVRYWNTLKGLYNNASKEFGDESYVMAHELLYTERINEIIEIAQATKQGQMSIDGERLSAGAVPEYMITPEIKLVNSWNCSECTSLNSKEEVGLTHKMNSCGNCGHKLEVASRTFADKYRNLLKNDKMGLVLPGRLISSTKNRKARLILQEVVTDLVLRLSQAGHVSKAIHVDLDRADVWNPKVEFDGEEMKTISDNPPTNSYVDRMKKKFDAAWARSDANPSKKSNSSVAQPNYQSRKTKKHLVQIFEERWDAIEKQRNKRGKSQEFESKRFS